MARTKKAGKRPSNPAEYAERTLSVTTTPTGALEILLDSPHGFMPVEISEDEDCLVVRERRVPIPGLLKIKAQHDNVVGILERLKGRVTLMAEGKALGFVVAQGRLFYEENLHLRPVLMDFFAHNLRCGDTTVGAASFERAELILNQKELPRMAWDLPKMQQSPRCSRSRNKFPLFNFLRLAVCVCACE
jgi:hypothetical protein